MSAICIRPVLFLQKGRKWLPSRKRANKNLGPSRYEEMRYLLAILRNNRDGELRGVSYAIDSFF